MLFPQNNRWRQALKLDGVWQFMKDPEDQGMTMEWMVVPPGATRPMPVPAAFNEMTQDPALRDYWGKVWYFTRFDKPLVQLERQVLRFGAVHRHSTVWLNGQLLGENDTGKLPFEFDISNIIQDEGNLLAVCVDTRLTWQTLPPGETNENNLPTYHFDFLNFGGILRSVWLCQTSENYIEEIFIQTESEEDSPIGLLATVNFQGEGMPSLRLLDVDGKCVAEGSGENCLLAPEVVHPWSVHSPYLYTLEVTLGEDDGYRLKTGMRTVRVEQNGLFLNGAQTYLKGFGLHEDFHLIGHGHSDARCVKDLTMLKEMGANSFRTAHYPYAEEVYQLADELGLLVIDEAPAVGMSSWGSHDCFTEERINGETLAHHKSVLKRLYERDTNHPSVIMWCLANESADWEEASVPYFKSLTEYMREMDPFRPVTIVTASRPPEGRCKWQWAECVTKCAPFIDVICYNRYYSWYTDPNPGRIDIISNMVRTDIEDFHKAFPDKPLMITEFGADAVAGIHSDPPVMFSEEYQWYSIEKYLKVMDEFPFVIGEHLWNFADFMTKQGLTRINGNRKGIHTRDRQPKMAAHFLKQRWLNGQ